MVIPIKSEQDVPMRIPSARHKLPRYESALLLQPSARCLFSQPKTSAKRARMPTTPHVFHLHNRDAYSSGAPCCLTARGSDSGRSAPPKLPHRCSRPTQVVRRPGAILAADQHQGVVAALAGASTVRATQRPSRPIHLFTVQHEAVRYTVCIYSIIGLCYEDKSG